MVQQNEKINQLISNFRNKIDPNFKGQVFIKINPIHKIVGFETSMKHNTTVIQADDIAKVFSEAVELREIMKNESPDSGAWLECLILVQNEDSKKFKYDINFNYFEPPKNLDNTSLDINPILKDLKDNPRVDSFIPDWVRFEQMLLEENLYINI